MSYQLDTSRLDSLCDRFNREVANTVPNSTRFFAKEEDSNATFLVAKDDQGQIKINGALTPRVGVGWSINLFRDPNRTWLVPSGGEKILANVLRLWTAGKFIET